MTWEPASSKQGGPLCTDPRAPGFQASQVCLQQGPLETVWLLGVTLQQFSAQWPQEETLWLLRPTAAALLGERRLTDKISLFPVPKFPYPHLRENHSLGPVSCKPTELRAETLPLSPSARVLRPPSGLADLLMLTPSSTEEAEGTGS